MAKAKEENEGLVEIQGKTDTLYFDTKYQIQNDKLESRYKSFKDKRDKELQMQVSETYKPDNAIN